MRNYIKVFLFVMLLLTCGCNSIDFNDMDIAAVKKLFEEKGFTGVTVHSNDSKFFRSDGKLMAKVLMTFEYKPLYEGKK